MAKRVMKRRRSRKRFLLLIVLIAGLIYAGAHILIRQPEVKAQEDPTPWRRRRT